MSAEAFHCLSSFPVPHARVQQVVSAEEINLLKKLRSVIKNIMPPPPLKKGFTIDTKYLSAERALENSFLTSKSPSSMSGSNSWRGKHLRPALSI